MAKRKYKVKEEKIITEPKEGYLTDYITGQLVRDKPEEREAKQVFAKRLVEEYGYSKKQIQTHPEFLIQKGSKKIGPADIVVFRDEKNKTQDNLYIIAETKRKDRSDGIDQLKSYLSPTKAAYGVWFNGKDIAILKHLERPPYYQETLILPRKGEREGIPLRGSLRPAVALQSIFKTCHNHIYAQEGLSNQDAFDEFLKLLFTKMADEKGSPNERVKFWITEDEEKEIREGGTNEFVKRINSLFDQVKRKYKDVFPDQRERINLRSDTIAFVVSQLKNFNFSWISTDAKGGAFQTFIHSYYRGERGQFFTPPPITQLAVEMLDPEEGEVIIDPACGSGGFLVTAIKYVIQNKLIPENRKDDQEYIGLTTKRYANEHIRGIDINPRLTRVAKMRMILEDDGHTGIISANSLAPFSEITQRARENDATKFKESNFDILLTNPPFGSKGKETNKAILRQFQLARKWKEIDGEWQPTQELRQQVPDILFIERCLEFLKDRGRMAIVLPDGDLTNSTLRYVREFIKNNARILAVVSLPPETFNPYGTGVKASVLFLQKLPKKELKKLKRKDYPIFMAIIEKIGYDIRGREVYKRNEKGKILRNKDGESIIDTDVPKVIEKFREFREKNKLEF